MQEADVRAVLDAIGRPKRRARPRIAPSLVEAEHAMIAGVATWRTAPGPGVLLAHGWEDDNALWEETLQALWRLGCPAVAIDLPGHGYSEGDTLDVLSGARALAEVAATAGPIFAVAAHSYGCVLTAFAIAEFGFRPKRAAFLGAPVVQRDQFVRRAEKFGLDAQTIAAAIARWPETNGRPIEAFDLRRLAPQLGVGGLVVHALDDEGCPIEAAQEMAAAWPGAQTLFVDGLGHRGVALDPEVAARVAGFLDGGV